MAKDLGRCARHLAVAFVVTYDTVFVIEFPFLIADDLLHRFLNSGKIPVASAVIHLAQLLGELFIF